MESLGDTLPDETYSFDPVLEWGERAVSPLNSPPPPATMEPLTYPTSYSVEIPMPLTGKTSVEKMVQPVLGDVMESMRHIQGAFLGIFLGEAVPIGGSEIKTFNVVPNRTSSALSEFMGSTTLMNSPDIVLEQTDM